MLTSGPTLYPPTTPAGFRRLLHAIHTNAQIDRLKRDCFLYYLVRDADAAARPGPTPNGDMDVDSSTDGGDDDDSRASTFARRRCLPRTWRVFMDGYWFLDHGRWAEAVAALSDPAISELNFVPEVVQALTTLVAPPQSLRLVYELLDARELSSATERDAALLAKASVAGMSAAFAVIRSNDDPAARAAGREAVWCWSLGAPRTPAGKGAHTAQPRALRELLHLAMHDEESSHLVYFLAHPPREIAPPARSLLHDLVTLRLVHAGKYEETLALDRELAGTDAASAADRQRRREMVREFIDILPEAQRRILLGEDYKRGAAAANGTVANGGVEGDVDMASSWVHVESPSAALPPALPAASAAPATPGPAPAASTSEASEAPAPATAPAAPSTPGPIAPQPVRLAQRLGIDGTPSRNGTGSPFGGPPRFASPRPKPESSAAPSTSSRQASPTRAPSPPAAPLALRAPSPPLATPRASPFVAPTPSSSKPARKPKRVINDDGPSLRRSTRNRSEPPEEPPTPMRATSRAPSEAPIPEDAPAPTPPTRRGKRTTKKADKEVEEEEPAPTPKPARTRRGAGGRASSRASTVEPVEEEDDEPKIPGAFGETPARRTRKAAKAELDEPEAAPKRTRAKAAAATTTSTRGTRKSSRAPSEAPSEVSEAPSATPVRRTRRAAASERGSPTPSVASTVGSPQRRSKRTTRSRRAD